MSLPKSKRKPSSVQFLETAKELYNYTRKMCVTLPKRYTFFGLAQMFDCACRMREFIKKGNSLFPSNKHEVQMRRDCFLNAKMELQALADHIGDIREIFPIEDKAIVIWLKLLTDEKNLLTTILERDKERYNKANFKE